MQFPDVGGAESRACFVLKSPIESSVASPCGPTGRLIARSSIANIFKEVIFSDPEILSQWLSRAPERDLAGPGQEQAGIEEAAARVMYGIGGFGRVPDGFENWLSLNVK